MRLVRICFCASVTAVLAAGVLTGCGSQERSQDQGQDRSQAFTQGLESSGFLVNAGSAAKIDAAEMVDQHAIDSAAGNNAGQPYKTLDIPTLPQVEEDPDAREVRSFHLRADEAIVYVGPTPPQGDYFSFTPFLFNRKQQRIQPKGDWMFAALGDPLNNAGIKTEDGGPFGADTMIVFTADQGVYDQVAQQARAAGYPDSMINLYPLPSALLDMGATPDSDSFLILVRTANLAQPAGDAYLNNDSYATVLRVTPSTPPTLDPIPTLPMRDRAWKSETDLFPDLAKALERLQQAILASGTGTAATYGSTRWWPESRDVLTAEAGSPLFHKFVAGEAADTPYRRTDSFALGDGDQLVVFGVNHQATGLATYSNFSVYSERVLNPCGTHDWPTRFGCGDPVWSGVAGMTSKDFAGSAEKYIPGDPMAPYLYAVTVSRDATAGADVTIPEPDSPDKPATGIRPGDRVLVGYRAYLNPATGVGPAYSDVIPDRAVVFTAP